MEIERNKNGTIKGVSTMGDLIPKEKKSAEEKERERLRAEYEKKHNIKR